MEARRGETGAARLDAKRERSVPPATPAGHAQAPPRARYARRSVSLPLPTPTRHKLAQDRSGGRIHLLNGASLPVSPPTMMTHHPDLICRFQRPAKCPNV